ncbi:MAG: LPS export ABC transporter periplasmic protein LptC [Desulfurivibrionaceae bacterium]|nr:LPS export ABC transporter periplasmic protein LptC [Desulfurivibrionaceae bacterium]
MIDLKRNSIWFLPLMAVLSAPLWWPMAGALLEPRGDFDAPPPPVISQLKSFVMEQVVLTQHRNGREEFVLEAARINSGIHEDVLEMEKIEARLFGADGRPAVLTGGEAFYHTGREIITVIDDVLVQTPEGREMRTAALRYLVKYRKVKTAEAVLLTDDNLRVAGNNLFYDLVDGTLRLGGGVSVDLY